MTNKSYCKIREWLSEQEHEQWKHWSKIIAKELIFIKTLIENDELDNALHKIEDILWRWEANWIPYKKLSDKSKDSDREWADKILDNLPFKCPIYQCGGIMISKERPYPKGMNEDDFTEGMVGDFQTPDLVCTNCKAVYCFTKFK